MVTKFNTNAPSTSGGGNTKTIMIVVGALVAGYLVWRYVIKPAQDKKKKEQEQNKE